MTRRLSTITSQNAHTAHRSIHLMSPPSASEDDPFSFLAGAALRNDSAHGRGGHLNLNSADATHYALTPLALLS